MPDHAPGLDRAGAVVTSARHVACPGPGGRSARRRDRDRRPRSGGTEGELKSAARDGIDDHPQRAADPDGGVRARLACPECDRRGRPGCRPEDRRPDDRSGRRRGVEPVAGRDDQGDGTRRCGQQRSTSVSATAPGVVSYAMTKSCVGGSAPPARAARTSAARSTISNIVPGSRPDRRLSRRASDAAPTLMAWTSTSIWSGTASCSGACSGATSAPATRDRCSAWRGRSPTR